MNNTLKTVLIVVVTIVVAGGLFFAGMAFAGYSGLLPGRARGYAAGPGWMMGGAGPGMMGRNDRAGGPAYGPGGMHPGGMPGMMGGYGYGGASAAATPLTVEQAKAAAGKYIAALNNSDLAIADVMIFDNNAYVAVKETSTGRGAFELLVDPFSQVAYPEHGPNMMWNTKYSALNHQNMMGGYGGGMMRGSGMMRGYAWSGPAPADAAPDMTVTAAQAVQYAQKYLDANLAGATAAQDPLQFYGYYTLDFSRDGKVAGMLSVNGYTGQVFLHTWHGAFIQEAQ